MLSYAIKQGMQTIELRTSKSSNLKVFEQSSPGNETVTQTFV